MDEIIDLTKVYIVILLLALLVERFMEIVVGVWNFIEWKANLHEFWNRKAEKLKRKFESRAKSQILSRVITLSPLARQIRHATRYKKRGHSNQLVIVSGEMIRHSVVATASRIVAAILGVILCSAAGINIIESFQSLLPDVVGKLTNWSPTFQVILSGIVIGLGSEPIHNLIEAMEKRRASRAKKAELDKALSGRT